MKIRLPTRKKIRKSYFFNDDTEYSRILLLPFSVLVFLVPVLACSVSEFPVSKFSGTGIFLCHDLQIPAFSEPVSTFLVLSFLVPVCFSTAMFQ